MNKIGPSMQIVFGLVGIFIALIMFPLVLTGVHTILTDANIADYTGLSQVAGVAPLLIFLGLLASSGYLMVTGIKGRKSSRKSKTTRSKE